MLGVGLTFTFTVLEANPGQPDKFPAKLYVVLIVGVTIIEFVSAPLLQV